MADPKVELLMDSWSGKAVPTVLDMNGEIVTLQGTTLTPELANQLLGDPNSLLPTKANADFMSKLFEICSLA